MTKTITGTGSLEINLSESVSNGQTDFQINVAIDVSAVKTFYLVSDQAVTVETNNGTTPTNTISLTANDPYVWWTNSYDTFKLTGDVTALFITNASGSTANIELRAIVDATP